MQNQLIEISQIRPHPKNPRLVMREDVISGIVAGIETTGFLPCYSLQVWPDGDSFVILSGHHRLEAARRAGFREVPCYVREDIDEDAAYMVLATANNQGELSPLEIGCHAYGLSHGTAKAYAATIGKSPAFVSQVKSGYEVAKLSQLNFGSVMDKTQHLAAIHALPKECWNAAAEYVISAGLSAKETQDRVKEAGEVLRVGINEDICPRHMLGVFTGTTTKREIARIGETLEKVAASLESNKALEVWGDYCNTFPIDIKEVQAKRIEVENIDAELKEKVDLPPAGELPNLILADPPWRYDFAETDNRQIENQYPSATVDEIIDMRPETQSDCVLFLWATVAKLREAFEVLDGWGYEYKTHAAWDKEKIGMGYWFRGQHELLIVATKGKVSPPDQENRVSSVFREPRGKHSAKPECVYQWIERAFPDKVKLEMFCRSPRIGWKTFGNESK